MNKNKLVLGITAAALSVTLAVGGTLMLFSANTETATNVVTLGNVGLKLKEHNSSTDDTGWQTIGEVPEDGTQFENGTYSAEGKFEGLVWGDADARLTPGATIDKYTQVENSGSVAAYVAIRVDSKVEGSDTTAVAAAIPQVVSLINANYANLENLTFVTDDDDILSGWLVYTNSGVPAALASGDTITLVEPLTIPIDWDNSFTDIEFSVAFTAYAVQFDNVNYSSTGALLSAFGTQFASNGIASVPATTPAEVIAKLRVYSAAHGNPVAVETLNMYSVWAGTTNPSGPATLKTALQNALANTGSGAVTDPVVRAYYQKLIALL